jgi:ABC-type nickel/cobalt efflux system permease component RcnA
VIASGLLLVLLGLWLMFQTLAGNLPQRIVSWATG